MRRDIDITKRALPAALFVHVALALAVLAAALQPRPPAAPPPPIEPSYEVTLTAPPSPSPSFSPAAPAAEAPMGRPSPESRSSSSSSSSRATALLRDPAGAGERSLGLGPEGPVLRALGDATTASFALMKGRAVFRAIADRTGMIIGIEVVDGDGDGDGGGWANAAELALDALRGKKLRMPSTAKRATMRIEIVSELKMPSGHDPGVDVSILGVPITKGDGRQATQVRILDPLSMNAFALGGDPVDIGAKARRVVRSRLLDSEIL